MKKIFNCISPYRLFFYVYRCIKITSILNFTIITMILLLGSSASGETLHGAWTRVVEHAEFSPRDTAEGAVFSEKMWLSNAWHYDGTNERDLWSSDDGARWTKVHDQTPYDLYSELVVYKEKLWAIKNSVWCSENGVDWDRVLENTPFGSRLYGEVVVHDGKMWQLGSGPDVWWSTNGIDWICATPNAPYGDRWASGVAAFNGKLWVMGGAVPNTIVAGYSGYSNINAKNDVWSSIDGKIWTRVAEHAPWQSRMWFVAQAYMDRLWVMGGYDNDSANFADAYYTRDGVNWQKYESDVWWSARHEPTPYVFNGSLWIVSGNSWPTMNDVWRITPAVVAKDMPWLLLLLGD